MYLSILKQLFVSFSILVIVAFGYSIYCSIIILFVEYGYHGFISVGLLMYLPFLIHTYFMFNGRFLPIVIVGFITLFTATLWIDVTDTIIPELLTLSIPFLLNHLHKTYQQIRQTIECHRVLNSTPV